MHIKSLSPIFFEKAIQVRPMRPFHPLFVGLVPTQLRDIWLSMHSNHTSSQETPSPVQVDVLIWLSRATLDVIGQAGALCLFFYPSYPPIHNNKKRLRVQLQLSLHSY